MKAIVKNDKIIGTIFDSKTKPSSWTYDISMARNFSQNIIKTIVKNNE